MLWTDTKRWLEKEMRVPRIPNNFMDISKTNPLQTNLGSLTLLVSLAGYTRNRKKLRPGSVSSGPLLPFVAGLCDSVVRPSLRHAATTSL